MVSEGTSRFYDTSYHHRVGPFRYNLSLGLSKGQCLEPEFLLSTLSNFSPTMLPVYGLCESFTDIFLHCIVNYLTFSSL